MKKEECRTMKRKRAGHEKGGEPDNKRKRAGHEKGRKRGMKKEESGTKAE